MATALAACVLVCGPVAAEDTATPSDPHAHHRMMAANSEVHRTVVHYTVPDVALTRADGSAVRLAAEINDGRPVVLTFIYTSCTTVCPLLSHTFSQLQRELGDNAERVHLVSISIDPEQDTPARLLEHARTFHAGPDWQLYTGSVTASETAQRAFDVYRGNKMNHTPTILIRSAPGADWVRLDGFSTADQLLQELTDAAHPRVAQVTP